MTPSSHSTPLWLRLLKHQRDEGLTGFTLSFLIGASLPVNSKLEEDAAYGELSSLLTAFMKDTPRGYHVVIARCTGHHQPIASLYSPDEPTPSCDVVLEHTGKPAALYAEPRYFGTRARDLDSLAAGLWTIFKAPLVNGEYSYRQNCYCAFDSGDLKRIAAAPK